jgi:adenine-specific DNA-methyltransferase
MDSAVFQLRTQCPVSEGLFPTTRYQGSKRKLLSQLHDVFARIQHTSALDLYSGTGTVSLLLRSMGATVHANDLLGFNREAAFLLLNSTTAFIADKRHDANLAFCLTNPVKADAQLVQTHYSGIYFTDEENRQIDQFCQNVRAFDGLDRALYIYCVGQALLMKRPYNLFHRSNLAMRTRDVKRSFGNAKTWETSTLTHAQKILRELRKFPFGDGRASHVATCHDADDIEFFSRAFDVVYLDPPYLNRKGQGVDYCDFYHFLEGLVDYKLFGDADGDYPHRPIVRGRSAWLAVDTAIEHLARVVRHFERSTIVLSYRTDGRPSMDEIANVFAACGRGLDEAVSEDYKYVLSRTDETKEIILTSDPAYKV